jgi:2-dehydro-3-deoxyphosphogluconate aldolase/(4S)-4-hydroxy-2-oxoglutarate aldolase
MSTGTGDAVALPPVVAVLRAASNVRLPDVCEVLYGEGFRAFEFTFTTPGAMKALEASRQRLPGDAVLGAGTIVAAADVDEAAEAGAQFGVSPVHLPNLLDLALDRGLPFVPGTASPTEAYTAWRGGASMVKVWPAGPIGGPAYLRAVLQVFPDLPLMPSGGVTMDDIGSYLAAGAASVGLGGVCQGDAADPGGDLTALANRAAGVMRAVRKP